MNATRRIPHLVIYLVLLLFLARCGQQQSELSPKIAALMGTWQLVAPDTTFKVNLIIGLDTANPPQDITPLLATGQSAVNSYSLRLFATLDGTMSADAWANTKVAGTPSAMTFEQTYFIDLQAVVRYDMPTPNRLYLFHGGSQPRVLTYQKVN